MPEEKLRQKIYSVSKETGVPSKKIGDMIWALMQGERENSELIRLIGVAKNALNQIKADLKEYLQPVSQNTSLNAEGLREAKDTLDDDYFPEEKMWKFIDESERATEIVTFLNNTAGLRPIPLRDLDQFTATTSTSARRAILMDFFGDIDQKRILCLGDDDLLSVALGKLGGAADIQVLDIDQRVVDAINDVSQSHNISTKTDVYDARDLLPRKYVGKFDVVFTDPPYTPLGIRLFMSRAVSALDPKNKAARVYVCYGNSDRAKERFLSIQKIFTDSGLFIRWIFDKFNRYQGAESIGSTSSLIICDVTPKTVVTKVDNLTGTIYTND